MPITNNEGLDLFKPTTVKLGKREITQKAERIIVTSNKLFLDKVKKVSESILTAKEMPRPKNLTQPQMSSNARIVLEKRYLKKDKTGKNIESPQDLYWRVASNISQADRLYEKNPLLEKTASEFYSLMAEQKFMPNSPTLRGAGRAMQQLSACFVKNQQILSDFGYKEIHKIKKGDYVITHCGQKKPVTDTYKRKFVGTLYSINIRGLIKPTLNVTPEHPILAVKKQNLICQRIKNNLCNGKEKRYCFKTPLKYKNNCQLANQEIQPTWTPVRDLRKGDYVATNTNRENQDTNHIKISDWVDNKLFINQNDRLVATGRPHHGRIIPDIIVVDNDFIRLAGYWLADGSLSTVSNRHHAVRFTFNQSEKKFADDVMQIMRKKFNLETRAELSTTQKTIQLRFHSIIVAELFYKLFGKGFAGKKIPSWIITLPQSKQFDLMVGLFRGDGCYHQGKKQDNIFISLSNEKLANDVWGILFRLGFNFNINFRMPKGGTKPAYRISASPSECQALAIAIQKKEFRIRKQFPQYIDRNGLILRPIDKITKKSFSGFVYNLEVQDDHSYLANSVASHNCFVLPIDDSLESIMTTLKNACHIFKTGGGCGYSFSRLRPRADVISTTGNNAGGPVGFMRVYNATVGEITQGGVRMGANMGMLRSDHPDIEEFISCKTDMVSLTNFNISVSADDKFMQAVEENTDYDLINPRTKLAMKKIKARDVFNKMCENAWKNGDPGMIFIDRVNNSTSNPVKSIGLVEATNPCGEQPLLPNESCVLGSINLAKFVKNKTIDWDELKKTTWTAQHFLDNVIDMNRYVVPEIEQMTKSLRRTGLGVMGFADMLIKLGFAYNSPEGIQIGEKVMDFININARQASEKLAQKRGAYPYFKDSDDYARGSAPVRNVARTTIAPTGTISVIADCSSGIEPIFALVHKRKSIWDKDGAKIELLIVDKQFENMMREQGIYSEEIMDQISDTGSVAHNENVPENLRKIFITAHDLEPSDHIKIQVAFQKNVDNAISKTINFPNSATIDDVKEAYLMAYQMGCKGITIYRDGSRDLQVLTVGSKDKSAGEISDAPAPSSIEPRQRPAVVVGTTEKISTGMGNLFITVNEDKEGLFEVFAQIGKSGGDAGALVEAIARMISIALRSRVPVDIIIEQLKGIRGSNPVWHNGELILSPPDALGKALERYLARQKELNLVWKNGSKNEGQSAQEVKQALEEKIEPEKNESIKVATHKAPSTQNQINLCPECGDTMIYEEGCVKCPGCKLTKCG